MRTAEDYRDEALALQPPGLALPLDPESTWGRLLAALGAAFARIEARSADLIDEADPRTTYELLPDWERVAGLPDECSADIERTLQSRRDALQQRLTNRGGQTPAYFIQRAAQLGHDIEITETQISIAGVLRAGEELAADHADRHAWTISLPIQTTYAYTAGVQVAGDRLGYYEPSRVECLFRRIKPAHTLVLWHYVT